MHDYLETEIDALQLAVYVETSAGNTRAFRFKVPDHALKRASAGRNSLKRKGTAPPGA